MANQPKKVTPSFKPERLYMKYEMPDGGPLWYVGPKTGKKDILGQETYEECPVFTILDEEFGELTHWVTLDVARKISREENLPLDTF